MLKVIVTAAVAAASLLTQGCRFSAEALTLDAKVSPADRVNGPVRVSMSIGSVNGELDPRRPGGGHIPAAGLATGGGQEASVWAGRS